jgi:nicotinamide mononucleotide transporter PnuC
MITYLGMTLPSALIAMIIWIKHPFEEGRSVVKVSELKKMKIIFLMISSPLVTLVFYYVLKLLDTPLLIISTISILTSFVASLLMFFRSRHYAIFYALNDLVLITIWTITSIKNPSYLPMVICFIIFFVNDSYAFLNWKSLKNEQSSLETIN